MKKVFLLAGGLFSLLFTSCTTNDLTTGSTNAKKSVSAVDVYVAGVYAVGAVYWKNGNAVHLPTKSGGKSLLSSIVVSGSDVYSVGWDTGTGLGTYWKNGEVVSLPENNVPNKLVSCNEIAAYGSDIYIGGALITEFRGKQRAAYWKNGVVTTLTEGVSTIGQVLSIAVAGNDVYTCGYETNNGFGVAKYWKNNVLMNLDIANSGTKESAAESIVVSSGNVYIAGYDNNGTKNVAKYWLNGTAVNLSDGTTDSKAHSITVIGSDVYVAGEEGGIAKYWKNGTAINLKKGKAESMVVLNNNVYVLVSDNSIGNFGNTSVFLNGVEANIGGDCIGLSLFVVAK